MADEYCLFGNKRQPSFCLSGASRILPVWQTAAMAKNRIREVRKSKDLTLAAVSEGTGLSTSYLSRLESGAREVDLAHIRSIAAAMGVSPNDLVDGGTSVVPIMGYVGAGAEVMPEFEQVPPEGLDQIEVIFPVPDGVIGFGVRGDSMLPRFRDGDVILAYKDQPLGTRDYLGQEVVVRTQSGHRYVKTLLRGPEPGTFNLESHNARTIEAVYVEWVGEIVATLPQRQVRKLVAVEKGQATRRRNKRQAETAGMDELPLASAGQRR